MFGNDGKVCGDVRFKVTCKCSPEANPLSRHSARSLCGIGRLGEILVMPDRYPACRLPGVGLSGSAGRSTIGALSARSRSLGRIRTCGLFGSFNAQLFILSGYGG